MVQWKTVAIFLLTILATALLWVVIDQRFKAHEVALKSVDEHVKQIIARQNNFVHALDNTYNLLMDHMRGINPKNIPLKEPDQAQPAEKKEDCK